MIARFINAAWRAAYRVGFRLARMSWRPRHPHHDGVVVAIWCAGRILVVRQSYRAGPAWPGGGIRRGEHPRDAARREMMEELGLNPRADDLTLAREMVVEWDFRHDHVRIFEWHLPVEPQFRIDQREILEARFVDPTTLLAEQGIPPFVRIYLTDLLDARPI